MATQTGHYPGSGASLVIRRQQRNHSRQARNSLPKLIVRHPENKWPTFLKIELPQLGPILRSTSDTRYQTKRKIFGADAGW